MIGCNETVTIIRHVLGDDADTYDCHTVSGASWFSKTTISTSGDGAKPANSFEVRIFDDLAGHEPKPGDFCARGTIGSVTKPGDLKNIESFRITAVGNNLRNPLPHWRVSGQ